MNQTHALVELELVVPVALESPEVDPLVFRRGADDLLVRHTHTHTHTYIYI